MSFTIKSPSRIHIGILDMKGDLGRIYGSVGLAVSNPNFLVKIDYSNHFKVNSSDERVIRYAQKIIKYFNLSDKIHIEVLERIPAHMGLGSGTQLALSIGYIITRFNRINVSIKKLAEILGRGRVSGIGTYAFQHGGFIVDGGVSRKDIIPPLVFRYKIPENWIFIIGIPNIEKGFSGKYEKDLMNKVTEYLRKSKRTKVCEASRILLLKMMPALINDDIIEFGRAVTLFEREMGKVFKIVQGGMYRSPVIGKGIKYLLKLGAYGAGQSSWGTAFYGILNDKDYALKAAEKLKRFLIKYGGGQVIVSAPNNEGAKIIA